MQYYLYLPEYQHNSLQSKWAKDRGEDLVQKRVLLSQEKVMDAYVTEINQDTNTVTFSTWTKERYAEVFNIPPEDILVFASTLRVSDFALGTDIKNYIYIKYYKTMTLVEFNMENFHEILGTKIEEIEMLFPPDDNSPTRDFVIFQIVDNP